MSILWVGKEIWECEIDFSFWKYQFSGILNIFCLFIAVWVFFGSGGRKYFPPCYDAYDVFVNNCLVLRTLCTGTPLCIQTRDWKEDELNIWLVLSHVATEPPSSSCKNLTIYPPYSLVSESGLICIEWEFGCHLLLLLRLLSPSLYRENEQWISLIFSIIIPLASDVFVWLNSPFSLNSPLKRKGWNIKNDRWCLLETHY